MTNQPQSLRGLKALVGIMAILIIIGTTVVVGTVIYRLYARFASQPTPSTQVVTPLASATPVSLPPPGKPIRLGVGQHITQITSAGANIAILVSTPNGEDLLLLNPVSGAIRTLLTSP